MSEAWNYYIAALVILNLVGCVVLLFGNMKNPVDTSEGEPLGHDFDGIQEMNNPLPKWWLYLFIITIIFSVIYLIQYPGLGIYEGRLGWTSEKQWQEEVRLADEKMGDAFGKFTSMSVEEAAKQPGAIESGKRLFLAHCSACHGSDGKGSKGFPNLADNAWIYGGSGEKIKESIVNGRNGMMPALGAALGEEGINQVIAFMRAPEGESLSGAAEQGQQKFATMCAACHGPDGKGNPMMGAPNLKDDAWLYGGTDEAIRETLMQGRQGMMPAHKDLLDEEKIHVISAYVKSLSM